MKRFLLCLLACVMIIGCLVSCDDIVPNSASPLAEEPDTPLEKEPNAPLTEKPDNPLDNKPNTGNNVVEPSRDVEDPKLLSGLIEYLHLLFDCIEPLDGRAEARIDLMSRYRILHVEIDPDNYYYVCGYFNDAEVHDNEIQETHLYCCAESYTWIRINNEADIPATYDGKRLIAAFQINGTSFVKDVLSNDTPAPSFEHFLVYTPKFENGINVAESLYCKESYIYSTDPESEYVLDSVQKRFHETYAFYCIELNEEYYIYEKARIDYKNNVSTNIDFVVEFGKYYDQLTEIMIEDQYTETKNENTYYYILFKIDEFVDAVWK